MANFQNGSFELGDYPDITGWTLSGTSRQIHEAVSSDGGNWSLDLIASGEISSAEQAFDDIGVNGISFDYLFRTLTTGDQILQAVVNGEHYFDIPPVDQYEPHNYVITCTGYTANKITFYARDDSSEGAIEVWVDGVILTATPDPTPIDLKGIEDIIGLSHQVDLTGVEDIIGIAHTINLQGITTASHGVASTFRCDIT